MRRVVAKTIAVVIMLARLIVLPYQIVNRRLILNCLLQK